MRETDFLLIRHGESLHNASGRWQGWSDSPLSERGRAQAQELASALAEEPVDALISSDLARALETARILSRALGRELRPLAALRELDLGEWSGLTRAQIGQRWPRELERFDSGDPDARPAGGESRRELGLRVLAAVADLTARHPGGRVALVTHEGVVAALLPGTLLGNARCVRARSGQLLPGPAVPLEGTWSP